MEGTVIPEMVNTEIIRQIRILLTIMDLGFCGDGIYRMLKI
jgi:hypothetical protein